MKLFIFDREKYEVTISPEVLTIPQFKKIVTRDKTKSKERAEKEIAFIYFFTDLKSDYTYLTDEQARKKEIITDLALPDNWDIDSDIEACIKLYRERSTSILETLYSSACKAAEDVAEHLKDTKNLLEERDRNGKPNYDISKITNSLQKIPSIMKNLKIAYQELVKEQQDTEGRTKGSKTFNIFEDGLH